MWISKKEFHAAIDYARADGGSVARNQAKVAIDKLFRINTKLRTAEKAVSNLTRRLLVCNRLLTDAASIVADQREEIRFLTKELVNLRFAKIVSDDKYRVKVSHGSNSESHSLSLPLTLDEASNELIAHAVESDCVKCVYKLEKV